MREIDGGDGGGGIVRTAVALSALSGEAVRVENARDDRPEPGLRPQHVAAVEAVAALCGADVEGAEAGARELVFDPGPLRGRDTGTEVEVAVGTAGSVTLVFDTLLPLSLALDAPAAVTVTGGTDVEWTPPMDYLRGVKLPLLSAAGLSASVSVERPGYYPLGGGEATLSLGPSSLSPLDCAERGPLRRVEVYSRAAAELREADVAERQAAAAREGLEADVGIGAPVGTETAYAETACPGSSLVVAAVYGNSRVGFGALGEAGKPSEAVAEEALEAFAAFHDGAAAVDRHLADQLLVYLAVAGGEVLAPERTAHVERTVEVLSAFGYDVAVEAHEAGVLLTA